MISFVEWEGWELTEDVSLPVPSLDTLPKRNKLQQSHLSIGRRSAWLQQVIKGQLNSRMLTSGNGEAQAGGIGSLCNLKSGQWGKSQPGCSGSPLPLDGKSPGLLCSDCSGLWLKSHARASIWKDLTSTWKLTFNLLSYIFISWFFFNISAVWNASIVLNSPCYFGFFYFFGGDYLMPVMRKNKSIFILLLASTLVLNFHPMLPAPPPHLKQTHRWAKALV